LLNGLATRFTKGHAAGTEVLRRALDAFEEAANLGDRSVAPWLWVAWFVAGDLWDSGRWFGLAEQAIVLARDTGSLNVLPVCLEGGAAAHVHAGEFQAAAALIEESDSISEATGNTPLRYTSLVLAAWRGDEALTMQLAAARAKDAATTGEGRVVGLVDYSKAVLFNGLGRYQLALEAAGHGAEHDDLELCGFSLVELVEAAARTGALDQGTAALARL